MYGVHNSEKVIDFYKFCPHQFNQPGGIILKYSQKYGCVFFIGVRINDNSQSKIDTVANTFCESRDFLIFY